MFNINTIDQINRYEKSEYKGLLSSTFFLQIVIFLVFLITMYYQKNLTFYNISSLFDFPLVEHIKFLLNSAGLILSIIAILFFTIIIIKKTIIEFTPTNGNRAWGLVFASIPLGSIAYAICLKISKLKI